MMRTLAITVIVFALAAFAHAQDKPRMVEVNINGVKSIIPENMAIEYIQRQTAASGTGAGYSGDPEAAKSLSLQAPNLTQSADGDVNATGGTATFAGMKVSNNSLVLYVAGILGVIGGVIIGMTTGRWKDWGLLLIGGGLLLIACGIVADNYPWVALITIVGIGGAFVWLLKDRITTRGVPNTVADALKAERDGLVASVTREFDTMIEDARQRAITTTDQAQIAEWTAYVSELQTRLSRIVK